MWANDKETGHAKLTMNLSSSSVENALPVGACPPSPLTTLKAAITTTILTNGHTGYPSIGARQQKVNYRCYAKSATARRGDRRGPTTTVNTISLRTISQIPAKTNRFNVHQPLCYRQDFQSARNHQRAPRYQQHSICGPDVASPDKRKRKNAASAQSSPILSPALATLLGEHKVQLRSVQRRASSPSKNLLSDRLRLGSV
jgi:hypothetical protein